jgi:hypothetical protein
MYTGCGMPSIDWERFLYDHHRPHVLIVSLEVKKPRYALAKGDFDRLVARLGPIGNYAIKTDGSTIHIAFEEDADADRLAAILRPRQTTREEEWASKSLASIDGARLPSPATMLSRRRLNSKRMKTFGLTCPVLRCWPILLPVGWAFYFAA